MRELGLKLCLFLFLVVLLRPHDRAGRRHRRRDGGRPAVAPLSEAPGSAAHEVPDRNDGAGWPIGRRAMTIGTKSLLAGAHCLLLHPFYVARAWTALFGFPWDIRLWFAFALHDAGYFGCKDIDGPSGEAHVVAGARIIGQLFGRRWADECYRHSRRWAARAGLPISRLCLADKLAFAITRAWLYLPMARWTGELAEYMERSRQIQPEGVGFTAEELLLVHSSDPGEWLRGLQSYALRWVERHRAEFVEGGDA